jgi:hypothetical protein
VKVVTEKIELATRLYNCFTGEECMVEEKVERILKEKSEAEEKAERILKEKDEVEQ